MAGRDGVGRGVPIGEQLSRADLMASLERFVLAIRDFMASVVESQIPQDQMSLKRSVEQPEGSRKRGRFPQCSSCGKKHLGM